MALLVAMAVVVLGPGAGAQTAPPQVLEGVTVSPSVVSRPDQEVTVTVPGFAGENGCRFGTILAQPGATAAGSRLFVTGDFDMSKVFSHITAFEDGPFAAGRYSIVVKCTNEPGALASYTTNASLTIVDSATTTTTAPPPTTPTTSSGQAATTDTGKASAAAADQGTVDPSTATAGVTTVTIRGSGFQPGIDLAITLATSPPTALGSTKSNDSGAYAATLMLPATAAAGNQQLLVTGLGPDGATRSTTVNLKVVAGAAGAGAPAAAGDSRGSAATTTLPKTGSKHAPGEFMVGLTALTLGALLIGLSHPAVPARGRRRRGRHFR